MQDKHHNCYVMEKVHKWKKLTVCFKINILQQQCASDKYARNSTQNDDPKTPEEFTITQVFREAHTFLEQSSQFQTLHFSTEEKKKST